MATYNSNNYSYDFDTTVKTPEQNKQRPRRIYSTALINQLIKDRQMGYDIDYDPFYMRDLDLRAPGITFRMTEEEMDTWFAEYDFDYLVTSPLSEPFLSAYLLKCDNYEMVEEVSDSYYALYRKVDSYGK